MVDASNFYIRTDCTWSYLYYGNRAYDLFSELKNTSGIEIVRPYASSSYYAVDAAKNEVYRLSNHWGRVASCFWFLDKDLPIWQLRQRLYVIAKANFSDFIQKPHPVDY